MPAKEMFEELGFEFVDENRYSGVCIIYRKPYSKVEVFFIKSVKTYCLYNSRDVSVELHKAITQQLKELGWL